MRNRNIANTFWNISDTFLYPVIFFGSTSFFIHKLGTAQFGIWMLINTIVVSMQLFNFGVGSSVFRNIAYHTAQHNEDGKRQVMSNAISVTAVLFGISLVLAAVGSYLVYRHDLLHVEPAFRALCAKGIILAGFIVGFKFFEQVFSSYFKSVEKFNKAMVISSGNKLTALLLNIFLLAFFQLNILHLLLVIVLVNVVYLTLAFVLLYKDFPQFHFRFDLKLPRTDAGFALFTWLQSLAIILTFQADRYFVVNYFGLAVLSYYALIATIFNHLHMGFSAVLPWLAPKLTKLYARNADSRELFMAARNLIAVCSFVFLLALFLLYPFFFHLILGGQTATQVHEYTRYFIVFELFFALNIVPNYYFNAVGHERKYFFFILFFTITCLLFMIGALKLFGEPLAVLYGLIGATVMGMFVQNILLNKVIKGKADMLSAALTLLPSLLIAYFMVSGNTVAHWICLALSIPSLYFVYLKGNLHKFKMLFRA